MNTPNPLIPQGSLQQHSRGNSNVRLAVLTIVAVHVVLFSGLLLQGCKRDTQLAGNTQTNADPSLTMAPFESNNLSSLYYTNPTNLPAEQPSTSTAAVNTATAPTETVTNLQTETTAPTAQVSEGKEYTIVRNDSFYKIAKANGIPLAALVSANPNVDPNRLRVGAKIKIPAPEPKSPAAPAEGASGLYVVKSGDTLTKLAKRHNTTVAALRAANGLKTSRLLIGQKLTIPAATQPQAAAEAPAPAQQ